MTVDNVVQELFCSPGVRSSPSFADQGGVWLPVNVLDASCFTEKAQHMSKRCYVLTSSLEVSLNFMKEAVASLFSFVSQRDDRSTFQETC